MSLVLLSLYVCLGVDAADQSERPLTGVVRDADGRPVAGVTVRRRLYDPVATRFTAAAGEARTDDEGRFRFEAAGDWRGVLHAAHGGASATATWWWPEPGEGGDVDLRLSGVAGTIYVKDEDGKPIAGARLTGLLVEDDAAGETYVSTETVPDWPAWSARSDADGRLPVAAIPAGDRLRVYLFHPDRPPARVTVEGLEDGFEADAVLEDGVPVRLRVADPAVKRVYVQMHGWSDAASDVGTTVAVEDGVAAFAVAPAKYGLLWLTAPGRHLSPMLDLVRRREFVVERPLTLDVTARPYATVRGRILSKDGTPPPEGLEVSSYALDPNAERASAPGQPPGHAAEWAFGPDAETDAEGRFEMPVPAGRVKFTTGSNYGGRGFIAEPRDLVADVPAGGLTLPDWTIRPIPPITGVVRTADGRPAAGAVVQLRERLNRTAVADADGRFQIELPWLPYDTTAEADYETAPLVAFDVRSPVSATTTLDLTDPDAWSGLELTLSEQDPWAVVRSNWTGEFARPLDDDRYDLRGSEPPPLVGEAWLNTERPLTWDSLRGRWVLLDFFFTDCGPCREETPELIRLSEAYPDRLTVIGVHHRANTLSDVREYVAESGILYPVVHDEPGDTTVNAFRPYGVNSFPTYLLVDPEGRVVHAPRVVRGPSLRTDKTAVLRAVVLSGRLPEDLFTQP